MMLIQAAAVAEWQWRRLYIYSFFWGFRVEIVSDVCAKAH